MPGEATHMQFVDDAVDQGNIERLIALPVEVIFHQQAVAIGTRSGLELSPGAAIRKRARVRIEENVIRIEAVDFGIGIRLHVEAVAVLHLRIESFDKDVPHLASAVGQGIERKLDIRICLAGMKEDERTGGGVTRENGEVHAGSANDGAQGQRHASTDAMSGCAGGRRLPRRAGSKGCSGHVCAGYCALWAADWNTKK